MRSVVDKDWDMLCCFIYVCTNGGLQGLCETACKYDDFKIIESR